CEFDQEIIEYSFISHWKNEKPEVKLAYENIAKEVEKELNDIRIKDLVYADIHEKCRRKRRKNIEKRARRSAASLDSFDACKNFVSTIDFSIKDPPVESNNALSSCPFTDKALPDSYSALNNTNAFDDITQFYDDNVFNYIITEPNNPICESNVESNFVYDTSMNANISATSQIDSFTFLVPEHHSDIASPYDSASASPTISEYSDFFPQLTEDFQPCEFYLENASQAIICLDNSIIGGIPDCLS
ncbi:16646_t:CDS:2, partial [Racocetra fulgida]